MLKKSDVAALALALAGVTAAPISQSADATVISPKEPVQKDSTGPAKLKAAKPCGPVKKKAANPCSPGKKKAANPCGPANPCAPEKRKPVD